jgi:hypothetical protein
VNRHLDFLPTLSLPGRGGGEAEARTAASSILLLASGGELLPTSEHRSFFPLKARILLCRGPVLWVLELPLELGFAGTCLDFFLCCCGYCVLCVVIIELGFAGTCLDFFFGEGSQIPCGLVYPTELYNRVCHIDRLVGFGLCRVMGIPLLELD